MSEGDSKIMMNDPLLQDWLPNVLESLHTQLVEASLKPVASITWTLPGMRKRLVAVSCRAHTGCSWESLHGGVNVYY